MRKVMKVHSIYYHPDFCDCYTVYFKGRGSLEGIVKLKGKNKRPRVCLGMNANPFSPSGFCQHGNGFPGKHNGKKIEFKDLPDDCQKAVENDLK